MLEFLNAVILGIVQGITEWLPVSSTGHMIIVDQFIHFMADNKAFRDLFLVVVQFGSILAVVTIYFHKLNPFSPKKTAAEKKDTWSMWFKVLVGCVPAAVIGLLFDDFIMEKFYSWQVVAIALAVYGVIFIVIEKMHIRPRIKSIDAMTYKTAALIGIFQVLAMIPGTSRSGSTIIGAMLIGTSRYVATEFSFFLAIPVMLGASALEILKYFLEFGMFSPSQAALLLVGMAVAYVVSVITIKFLLGFIRKNTFIPFGVYRILLAALVTVIFVVTGAQTV